jgi:large subunit ribosomal protein L10
LDRTEKEALVGAMHASFEKTNLMVIAHYSGLNVAEMTDLRGQMRSAGASLQVAKNKLAKLALKGTKFENLENLFYGPTAIALSTDPVAAAKIVVKYSKKNEKLIVLGGALGDEQLDVEAVKSLAELPSITELRGKLVGLINAPASRLAAVIQSPAGQLARLLNAHSKRT